MRISYLLFTVKELTNLEISLLLYLNVAKDFNSIRVEEKQKQERHNYPLIY